VTALDLRGGYDSHIFQVEVLNKNDPPEWTDVPDNFSVYQGQWFEYDVDAIDIDKNDKISYSIGSYPRTNITIDPGTGLIRWLPNLDIFSGSNYQLEVVITVNDGEKSLEHHFMIRVIPNPLPQSHLIHPPDDSIVSLEGVILQWEGSDDEDNDLLRYDLYLSEFFIEVLDLKDNTLIESDLSFLRYFVEGLEPGKTYYWTVIPRDKFSRGTCIDDVLSFRVNTLPRVTPVQLRTVNVGERFELLIDGSDLETEDAELIYKIIQGPSGLDWKMDYDILEWVPASDQTGLHIVRISIYDGLDHFNFTIEITVNEALEVENDEEDGGFPVWIMLVVIIFVLLVVIAIGSIVFLKRIPKKAVDERSEEKDDVLSELLDRSLCQKAENTISDDERSDMP
jgi:hypothetical protein